MKREKVSGKMKDKGKKKKHKPAGKKIIKNSVIKYTVAFHL